MKLIWLTGKNGSIIGNYCQVDDEDYNNLCKKKWNAARDHGRPVIYVKRIEHVNGKRVNISIHRLIMGVTDPKIIIDHKDGNPLNNQRSNLRLATPSQNQANRIKAKNKTSLFLGVSIHIDWKLPPYNIYWIAQCSKDKVIHTKCCKTEIEAACEYNKLALKYHREFAKLNIIEDKELEKLYMLEKEIITYASDTDTVKRCRRCEIYKNINEFGINKGKKNGRAACKDCRNKESNDYYRKTKKTTRKYIRK